MIILLCRLGVDEELTDSENEEEEHQKGPSNQTVDEGLEPRSEGKEDDSEPCCSLSVMDNTSNKSSEPESAPKVDTEISTDDKELPPHDQEGQSSEDHEVKRGMGVIHGQANLIIFPSLHSSQ